MAKRPDLREDEQRDILRSVTDVGRSKPVGYLPLATIRDVLQLDPKVVADAATARGLVAAQFGPEVCCIKSGALYVYHREALANILKVRTDAISMAGLPSDPDRFIAVIAATWFEEDHPARPIIAAAFG
jgi:hypothetical protein